MNISFHAHFIALLFATLTGNATATEDRRDFPPVQIVDHQVTYRVAGDSVQRINEDLIEQRARLESAGNGSTRSHFTIDRRQRRDEGRCELAWLQIHLSITTTLPVWQPVQSVSSSLRQQWQEAEGILRRHEKTHRDHAVSEARQLRRVLLGIGARRSCLSLDAAIDLALQSSIQRLNLRDTHFDHRTWNGLRDDPLALQFSTSLIDKPARRQARQPDKKLQDFYIH